MLGNIVTKRDTTTSFCVYNTFIYFEVPVPESSKALVFKSDSTTQMENEVHQIALDDSETTTVDLTNSDVHVDDTNSKVFSKTSPGKCSRGTDALAREIKNHCDAQLYIFWYLWLALFTFIIGGSFYIFVVLSIAGK